MKTPEEVFWLRWDEIAAALAPTGSETPSPAGRRGDIAARKESGAANAEPPRP